MKKVFLALLFLGSHSSIAPASFYNQLRQDFKRRLYSCQVGLMKKDPYERFIEPYIQDAEKKLVIPQYGSKNPNAQGIQFYFGCLVAYNCAYFNYYAKPNAFREARLEYCGEELLTAIRNIQEKEKLGDVDVQVEYNKTIELFQKANIAYYKKLGLGAKAKILLFA